MRKMEYEVEREEGQWHVTEKGQTTRGTTLTDGWLKQMGFWPLSRTNIDDAMNATMAMAGGMILDQYAARHPMRAKDMSFTPGFKNFPQTNTTGRLPRNPKRMHVPDRLMIKG